MRCFLEVRSSEVRKCERDEKVRIFLSNCHDGADGKVSIGSLRAASRQDKYTFLKGAPDSRWSLPIKSHVLSMYDLVNREVNQIK